MAAKKKAAKKSAAKKAAEKPRTHEGPGTPELEEGTTVTEGPGVPDDQDDDQD